MAFSSSTRRVVLRLHQTLVAWQVRRPVAVALACLSLAIVGGLLARRLELRTQFGELLPEQQPSVQELRRVVARTPAQSTVFVVLQGDDPPRLRAAAETMLPRLRALGEPYVASAEAGVRDARDYLRPRAGLFLPLTELASLRDEVQARWDWEIARSSGIDLSDDPPPAITAARLESKLGKHGDGLASRWPDGYFQSADGKALVVVIRSSVVPGDLGPARETVRRIQRVANEDGQGLRVSFAGDLVTSLFEYGAVRDDLVHVGTLGIGLVLAVILVFYMRIRALLALGLTMLVGLSWTFGATYLAIGHLNVASGFLVSIVAGNGINFGIIFLARLHEARRHGATIQAAVEVAHRDTWRATLAAALAAAAAYGSLGITDFRGFRHFAFIGSAGMGLCWIATYTVLPAAAILLERMRPASFDPSSEAGLLGRLRTHGARYDAPFAWLVSRFPRILVVAGGLVAIAGSVLAVRWLRSDPMEYDMRRIRNDLGDSAEVKDASALAHGILGANLGSGMVVVLDRLDQVRPLVSTLHARRDLAAAGAKPFEAVHSIFDFVPEAQADKLPVLLELRAKIVRAHDKKLVDEADWARIQPLLPPIDLRPFGVDDLPASIARSFTERDGTRGRLVYIEPTSGMTEDDLRYLVRWADGFRETRLPSGEVVRGSGRAVIFADIVKAVNRDMPRAVVLSFVLTAAAVVVVVRRGRASVAVLSALLVGVAWLAGFLAIARVRLNFLNFIALPITFGIGVDYAVNVIQRHGDGKGAMAALRGAGGAVVLCSLTTILGYLALLGSLNQGVRSLGLLAVIGEACCLVAAVVVLPAWLHWGERRA